MIDEMNGINERQNADLSIEKLASQNQVYGDAKNKIGLYLILSIPVMIIINALVKPALINDWMKFGFSFDLTDSIALFALSLSAYEIIFLRNSINEAKEKAAKIQEDFDCSVYQLEWNNLLCGDKVCDSEIKKYSDKYSKKGKDRSRFIEWYTPDVSQVDEIKAILLCQKENLGWDIEQRKKFINFVSTISIMVFVISLIAGFYFDISLKTLILSVIIPSWPAFSYAIANYFENKQTIKDKAALKSSVDKVERIKNPTVKYVRNIQNQIYLNRKTNAPIFDWFYDYLRNSNQVSISYATQQLVKRML